MRLPIQLRDAAISLAVDGRTADEIRTIVRAWAEEAAECAVRWAAVYDAKEIADEEARKASEEAVDRTLDRMERAR